MSTIDHKKMDKFVDGKLVSKGQDTSSIIGKHYWWKADEKEMGGQITATINFIKNHQSTRIEQLTANTRLYGNSSAFNFIGPALSKSASSAATSQSNRISFNLCAAVIDTMVSKIAKNRVVPQFITSGGVWGMQKKAENLTKFLEGCFHANDVHKKTVDQFRDGAVWGTGILKIFRDQDDIAVERTFPHQILVDEIEAMAANPRQIHEIRMIDRDILLDMFIDADEKIIDIIKSASPTSVRDLGAVGTAADILTVSESYHLRSGETQTDGLKVICLGDQVLHVEQWDYDYFPYVFFNYSKRLLGFWGQGACDRLQNIQGEINRGMITIQRCHWMMAGPKIAIDMSSKIATQHLNNDIGSIIHYADKPPMYLTPPIIQPDVYSWVDSLIAKGFQQEGVSQLAASSMKPAGVDSGAALRTYDQIGDDRLLYIGQEIERATLEIGERMIDVAKEIYKDKKTFKVVFPQAKFMESVDWKNVKLKEDEYVLKAYPTSSLPDDPAGRLAYVQEQMQAGLISPRAGRKLMTNPDIEMSDKLANASEDLINKIIEKMLEEDGEYESPEPYYDLALAKTIALQYYNYAALNNCPEDRLELLRRFMSQIDDLTGISAPQAMPQGAPMAAPMAQPQSNLIPNVGGMQ
jgi:hypothetical protein